MQFIVLLICVTIGFSQYVSSGPNCKLEFKTKESQESYNKHIILKFYRSIKNPQNSEAGIMKYIKKDGYLQHDPNVADGREALIQATKAIVGNSTRNIVEFIRNIGADEDLVWVHAKEILPNNDEYAVARIYRLECGLIAEHWDVRQEITPNTNFANSHPFF